VANFVLMGYGTGAIMAVPAHDERDHAFASRYALPIIQVVAPADGEAVDVTKAAWPAKEETFTVNSGDFSGLDFDTAFERIAEHIEARGIGERKVNYRLRDWGVSRQRYWGCPVPVIYCPDCGTVPVPDEDLPVLLPEDVTFMGVQSPIKADPDWRKTACPECGREAERETDTFDTFVESSWYYARYCTPNAEGMLDQRADYWLPVDHYIGGIEHAVLHLMYFRFWHKLMRDLNLVSSDEPATQLLCQGMVLAEAYYHDSAEQGRVWVRPDEVEIEKDAKGKTTAARRAVDGVALTPTGWTTMSKSKNNGVDPQTLVDRYGADTVRLFTMFASPPDQALEWNDDAVAGSQRFLRRLWTLVHTHRKTVSEDKGSTADLDEEARALRRVFHSALQKITRDMERHQFNTVVAACMESFNALDRFDPREDVGRIAVMREVLGILIRVLAPITPHVCHVLWRELNMPGDLLDAPWPQVDDDALIAATKVLVVQINGKLRSQIEIDADANDDTIREAVLADENVVRHVGEKPVRKVIVVPGKLVNVVI
jgi:leucyl-tRNA synthetase